MPYKERAEEEKKRHRPGPPPLGLQARSRKRMAVDLASRHILAKQPKAGPDPELLDRENAFLMYQSCNGDIIRTANALNAPAELVAQIADEEKWAAKFAPLLALRKFNPVEIERNINRSMNFIQANKLRMVLEVLITTLARMTPDELVAYCVVEEETTHKDGSVTREKKVKTRPFADLASALEKVHALTYAACNDTVTERGHRAKRNPDDEQPAITDIHAAIAKAMSTPPEPGDLMVTPSVEAAVQANQGKTIDELIRTEKSPPDARGATVDDSPV